MTDRKWKKVWLRIAEAYGEPGKSENDPITRCGLCAAYLVVAENNHEWYIGEQQITKQLANFADPGETQWGFWFPRRVSPDFTQEHDELRVLFACLFSNMTVKEFEEICQ